jgi:hypothetical protein
MARLEGTLVYWGDKLVEVAALGEDKVAFTPFIPPLSITYLVVAGGGGGGAAGGTGGIGGGGAGGVFVSSSILSQGSYSVTVGGGGAIGANGNDSAFLSKTGLGGGQGGDVSVEEGSNGGSGGGSFISSGGTTFTPGVGLQPTSSAGGFGNGGSTGIRLGVGNFYGGSGGGAGSAAGNESAGGGLAPSEFQNLGYFDVSYGGPGTYSLGVYAGGGSTTASGSGGFANAAGKNGIVIVKYQANEPLATGGIIESGSGFIYHKFNSNGTFIY